MRLLLALVVLLVATPAVAQEAPFDLDALRAKWPGANAVLLERHLVFSMPDSDTLRVQTRHQLAVLDDSVQEDLVLFSSSRRPGCRNPYDIQIRVLDRHGLEQPWDGEIIELVAGDHPVDADRSSVTLSASRRGLSAGALLDESWTVDYAAECFAGFLGTERYFVEGEWPVEHALVEIPCAGAGCFVDTDIPGALQFTPRDGGGKKVEAWDVPAPAKEFSAADQGLPVVIVGTSEDPLEAGVLLDAALDMQIARLEPVVDSHRELAERTWKHVKPRSVRLARYLNETVARLPGRQAFWQFGFDWGGPVAAGRRPLLPLEWWTLALAMLEPHGGVPVLIDTETHLAPPSIGRVVSYDAIGVLLPGRGVLLDSGWFPLSPNGAGEESNASLAGMWTLRIGDDIELVRLPDGAALEQRKWTLSARPSTGDKLLAEATREYVGEWGARLRAAWLDTSSRKEGLDRSEEAKQRRSFATEWLFGHRVGQTEVLLSKEEPSAFGVSTMFSRQGYVQRGDGLVAVALPIEVHPGVARLVVSGAARESDFAFDIADDVIELEIVAPAGYRLVDVPPDRSVDAGPVSLQVRWSTTEDGAKLDYRFLVPTRVISAEHAPALARIGEELRRLMRTRLLFVPES